MSAEQVLTRLGRWVDETRERFDLGLSDLVDRMDGHDNCDETIGDLTRSVSEMAAQREADSEIIAELGGEVARLRLALKEMVDLDTNAPGTLGANYTVRVEVMARIRELLRGG